MAPITVARRAGHLLGTLLLVAITIGCVAWIAPTFFGHERYVITGGSMTGAISKGSVVIEEHVPVPDLEVGDVITYVPPADSGVNDLVTHRIVDVEPGVDGERVFLTQGDANPDPDPWRFSLSSATQPVVTHSVPWVGYVFIALADPRNRMVAIGIPASLVALVALRDVVRALRPALSTPITAPVQG